MTERESILRPASARGAARRWIAWTGAGLLVIIGVFAAWPIAAGKTEPPVYSRAVAERALRDARDAGAGRWAPEALVAAESALRQSQTAYRTQEVRFLPLRDFSEARVGLQLAEEKARFAAAEAGRRRESARAAAEGAITKAAEDATFSEEFGDAMSLAPFERTLLQRSRIVLSEARIRFRGEDYEHAASLAREAGELARRVAGNAAAVAERFTHPTLVRNWRRMIDDTIAWSRRTGGKAIVVLKDNRRLDLYDDGRLVRSYPADMGYRSFNDKLLSGDAATPEGRYRIVGKRGPGSATYYRALDLDYPNAEDRAEFARLKRAGKISRSARLGGSIQIHGEGGRGRDWTRGCVAVTNTAMDDLFRRVDTGTPVTIVGGDGQGVYARLARQHASTIASGTR